VNYRQYLHSEWWKATRLWALERARYRCENCGARAVNVHHRTYERLGHEHPSDLQALCRRCHEETHGLAPDNDGPINVEWIDSRTPEVRHAATVAEAEQRLEDLARGYEEWVVGGRIVQRPASPPGPLELKFIHQLLAGRRQESPVA
jgi:hypothetical protein